MSNDGSEIERNAGIDMAPAGEFFEWNSGPDEARDEAPQRCARESAGGATTQVVTRTSPVAASLLTCVS
jgi:hypothetical protein